MTHKYDFKDARAQVEKTSKYPFTNPDLLQEALHAGDPTQIGSQSLKEENSMMAVVGDSVLDLLLHEDAWEKGRSNGQADARRQSVANDADLDKIGRAKGLHLQLIISTGPLQDRVSVRMIATALGAVYLESKDMQVAKAVAAELGLM